MYNLDQQIVQQGVDLALVQEPYLYQNNIMGISRGHRIFSSGTGKKRACVIISNKQLGAILIHQISDEDMVVLEVSLGKQRILAASVYFDITNDINRDLIKLEALLQYAKGKATLIAIDSNARSKTWFDVITNQRRKIMEEFILGSNLHILNCNTNVTTYESSRGTSNVDLTITNNMMLPLVRNWTCSNDVSCSDHRLIEFSIEYGNRLTKVSYIVIQGRDTDVKKKTMSNFN